MKDKELLRIIKNAVIEDENLSSESELSLINKAIENAEKVFLNGNANNTKDTKNF